MGIKEPTKKASFKTSDCKHEFLMGSFVIKLVVSTNLKNISEIGSSPQVGMKVKNIWNQHQVIIWHLNQTQI